MARIKRTLQADRDRRLSAATLGEIVADGLDVFCWCNRCGHNATLDGGRLLAELGGGFPVPEIGGRLRCTGCDGKDIATRPAWRGLGAVTSHGPNPNTGTADGPDDAADGDGAGSVDPAPGRGAPAGPGPSGEPS